MSRLEQEVHSTVLSLVDSGHDDRFQDWLRHNKLLIKSCVCKDCSNKMTLTKDQRILDRYKWICINPGCPVAKDDISFPIRHFSFFEKLPKTISLFDAFKVILLWCEGRSLNSIDLDSERQKRLTKQIFLQCDKVAAAQMREWEGKIRIGVNNEQSLVLMDTFPYGYMTGDASAPEGNISHSTQGHNQFVCFADVSFIPPLIWVHLLRQGNRIPQLASDIVHPNSVIITNTRTMPSEKLRQQSNFRAIDVEALRTLDVPNKSNICHNLETIWQSVLPTLEEAQHMPMANTRLLLSRFLWQQRFGQTAPQALYNLLMHIGQQFPLPR